MRNWLIVLLVLLQVSCHGVDKKNIVYPDGGYQYLHAVTAKDSNFYFYPIKDFLSPKDSVIAAYKKYFYQAFDEPNLSLSPSKESVFRFAFDAGQRSVVIVFKENEMIIKKAIKGFPAPYLNIANLNEL